MASPVNLDISKYFQSSEAFKPLQRRIQFVYSRGVAQKKAEQELALLKELSEMPIDPELFQKRVEDLFGTRGKAAIFELARNVLSQRGVLPLHSPKQSLKPPYPRAQSMRVVALPSSSNPLEDKEAFCSLLEKAKKAVAYKEKFSQCEIAILGQIRAVGYMMDGNMGFKEAISRCLSAEALKKAVMEIEIPPEKTRQQVLEELLKRLELEEFDGDDYKEVLPQKPKVNVRFHTVHLFANSDALPPQLKSAEQFRKLVEGIVILKFLFPEFCPKIFHSQLQKQFADALLDAYLEEQLCGMFHLKALEKYCSDLVKSHEDEFFTFSEKILNKQTISDASGPPMKPAQGALPDCFTKRPFDEVETTRQFMQFLGKLRYQWSASFEHLYSKEEQSLIQSLLGVSLLMDFLHSPRTPFEQSLRYVIPDFGSIDPDVVASLVAKIFPPSVDPVIRWMNTNIMFQHRLLFEFMMEYVQAERHNFQSQQALKLIPVLTAIQERIKQDSVPLKTAVDSVVNLKTSSVVCQSDDPEQIIQFLEAGFKDLMPVLQIKHPNLCTEVMFNRLQAAATKYKPSKDTPISYLRVQQRLVAFDEFQAETNMTWLQWIYYYFNHEALRDLFNCPDDSANVNTLGNALHAFVREEQSNQSS